VHRQLLVRTILAPAVTVPRDREMLAVWLDDVWSHVDSWVHSHAADHSTPDPGGEPAPA
jgi:hypothetical protein